MVYTWEKVSCLEKCPIEEFHCTNTRASEVS